MMGKSAVSSLPPSILDPYYAFRSNTVDAKSTDLRSVAMQNLQPVIAR